MKKRITAPFAILIVFAVSLFLGSCGSSSITGASGGPLGSMLISSQRDTDGDGLIDIVDPDDDNDGIPDSLDPDDDNDGIPDDMEEDRDGDDVIDDHDDNFVELKGFIESISGTDLTVFGTVVHVSDSTLIKGSEDVTLAFGDLVVGMWVEVHGFINDDESVDAVEISIEKETEDSPPDSLSAGDFAEVEAQVDSSGSLVVVSIEKGSSGDPTSYEAAVESVSPDEITVLGVNLAVTASTVFEDHTASGKTYADLQAGDPVEVKAATNPVTGEPEAIKIELKAPGDSHVEIAAEVTFIDYASGILELGGVTVGF